MSRSGKDSLGTIDYILELVIFSMALKKPVIYEGVIKQQQQFMRLIYCMQEFKNLPGMLLTVFLVQLPTISRLKPVFEATKLLGNTFMLCFFQLIIIIICG